MCLFQVQVSAQEDTLTGDQVLDWLKTRVPQAHTELMELKKDSPDEFTEQIHDIGGQIEYIESLRETNPQMADQLIAVENMEYKSWEVAQSIEESKNEAKRNELVKELKQILGKIFDIRQKERSLEIKTLQEEIRKLQSMVEKRSTLKEAIIEKRIREMTHTFDETMEWW
ncbi:MAG: hypothetical protein D3926_05095 [Desulfobacteraceae bacterium]|nr:MAG: hypothetical protein D3926_05095 [Desulfobacteraceae bacterium]